MSFKTILVHLDGHSRNTQTLRLACGLADLFGAHLAALYALKQLPAVAPLAAGAGAAAPHPFDVSDQLRDMTKSMVEAAEQKSGRSIEWRTALGSAAYNVVVHARHADLLVMTQEDPALLPAMEPLLAGGVVVSTGRPVLVVPYAGEFATCGTSVLVAWSGTRESSRAIADALPFLKLARVVNLVSFNPKGNSDWGDIPGADIGLWLTRHGVRVNIRQQRSADVDVGNQILSLANDLGSDLIVMGAYGHSRMLQFVLGGVTKTLLETMTVPVLLSH